MEACGASHHRAQEIRKLDHDVILLPTQHVKAYQQHQKNDYNDAQAITWNYTTRTLAVLWRKTGSPELYCSDLRQQQRADLYVYPRHPQQRLP